MRSVKLWGLCIFLVLVVFLLVFLGLANTRLMRIERYSIEGVDTYSVKRVISPVIFESYLLMDRVSIREELESLAYVDKAYFSFSKNELGLKLEVKEKGVVIDGKGIALFYDGTEFLDLDPKDIGLLKEVYPTIYIDKEYLLFMKRFGFSDDFIKIVSYLYHVDITKTLITKAEFEHNGNGSSSLRLSLDNLNATLLVNDLSKLDYLEKSLCYIFEDIKSQRYDTIFSNRLYELNATGLVRIKR